MVRLFLCEVLSINCDFRAAKTMDEAKQTTNHLHLTVKAMRKNTISLLLCLALVCFPACDNGTPTTVTETDEVGAVTLPNGPEKTQTDPQYAPLPSWIRGTMGNYALAKQATLGFNLDVIADKTGTAGNMLYAAPKLIDLFSESGYLEAEFSVKEISPPRNGQVSVILSIRKVLNIMPGPEGFKAAKYPNFELFTRRLAGKLKQKCLVSLVIERNEGDSTQDLGRQLIQKVSAMSTKDLSTVKGETLFSDQELAQIFSNR